MKNIEIIKTYGTLEKALADIRRKAINQLSNDLYNLDEYDLVDILKELNEDFHPMDELDDTFDHYTVTEVLEELSDIRTDDCYFNECSKTSGDDPWDVADINREQLAAQIYDDEIDLEPTDDMLVTLREAEYEGERAEEAFRLYDTAKALFEQAWKDDPEALINTLWTMNN